MGSATAGAQHILDFAIQWRRSMQPLLPMAVLCAAPAVGACSNNDSASTASPAGGDAATGAQTAKPDAAQSAAATPEPDYPQPAVVIPPRPKPGAPHGPGFDMP